MLKLIIGNKAYSSWSLRGWLACMQSGLPFDEAVAPIYGPDWDERRQQADLAPSGGKVPMLWDGDVAVWDSMAILAHLDERSGGTRFWPQDAAARAFARSMAAEMHGGFMALRREHCMNLRHVYPPRPASPEAQADIDRIVALWAQARARFGSDGDFLFGAFGGADIAFAPVVTRLVSYALPVPADARQYMDAVLAHPFMVRWQAEAAAEPWVIDRFERPDLLA